MEDESDEFIKELIKNHVSGQLKVAPEHCSAAVLDKWVSLILRHIRNFSRNSMQLQREWVRSSI